MTVWGEKEKTNAEQECEDRRQNDQQKRDNKEVDDESSWNCRLYWLCQESSTVSPLPQWSVSISFIVLEEAIDVTWINKINYRMNSINKNKRRNRIICKMIEEDENWDCLWNLCTALLVAWYSINTHICRFQFNTVSIT